MVLVLDPPALGSGKCQSELPAGTQGAGRAQLLSPACLAPVPSPQPFRCPMSSPTHTHLPSEPQLLDHGVSILRASVGVPSPGLRHARGLSPLLDRKARSVTMRSWWRLPGDHGGPRA